MRSPTRPCLLAALLCAVGGCWPDKGAPRDSGDSGRRAASSSDGGEAWCGDTVESCAWHGQGVCLEFINKSGVELWCDEMGATYGFDVTYSGDRCAPATRGSCDGLTGGDYGSLTATAYYDDDFPGDPEPACAEAGGVYAP